MERDYFGATQLVYNSLREYSAVVYSSEATLLKMNKDVILQTGNLSNF